MADDARVAEAAALEVIHLWPEGPPNRIEGVGPETFYMSPMPDGSQVTILRNVSEPTLTVYRPTKANGVGIIVAPGGGWRILAWDHEGIDVAKWLAQRGYTVFLLKYRVAATPSDPEEFAQATAKLGSSLSAPRRAADAPNHIEDIMRDGQTKAAREISVEDGRRALAIVKERAAEWGVEAGRIGMMGFSAGAFLTVDVALSPDGGDLAFVAPIYGGGAHGRSIPANAPPLFTCIAQDDRMLFRVVEGLYRDWSDADRPSEMHVFTRGGHGFGMVKQGRPVDRWIDLLGAWLADQGFA